MHQEQSQSPKDPELEALIQDFDQIVQFNTEMDTQDPIYRIHNTATFKAKTDPNTGAVTRVIDVPAGKGRYRTVYEINDTGITTKRYPDEMDAPLTIDSSSTWQSYYRQQVRRFTDMHLKMIAELRAEQEHFARTQYAPTIGSKLLRLVGIGGPYKRRQEQYEGVRDFKLPRY